MFQSLSLVLFLVVTGGGIIVETSAGKACKFDGQEVYVLSVSENQSGLFHAIPATYCPGGCPPEDPLPPSFSIEKKSCKLTKREVKKETVEVEKVIVPGGWVLEVENESEDSYITISGTTSLEGIIFNEVVISSTTTERKGEP